MYYVVVALTMLGLPAACICLDLLREHAGMVAALAKWYPFWAVGVRLLLAGGRQVVQPRYTVREILGLSGDEAFLVVRELGFANLALGLLGACSLFVPGWRSAAALVGGTFYLLAGLNHVLQSHRGRLQDVAMVTDLLAAGVLLFAWIGG